METVISFLVKHFVIFIGSGIITLFAFWILREVSKVSRLFYSFISKNLKEDKLRLTKRQKISTLSGLYELTLTNNKKIKLFSSHKAIRII